MVMREVCDFFVQQMRSAFGGRRYLEANVVPQKKKKKKKKHFTICRWVAGFLWFWSFLPKLAKDF
jgi:hypothetical protein